ALGSTHENSFNYQRGNKVTSMDAQALTAPDASLPLGRSRARVLSLLRDADAPATAHEIAAATGLHSNTARFHLEALVGDGLAVRETQSRSTPGRPGTTYRAAGAGAAGGRRYRLLAKMLASLITGIVPGADRAATEAGREWGAYLTQQPPPYQ